MITKIEARALVKVSGEDAEDFLQSQFSNDIKQINEKEAQINAYCQHQGKILAVILVLKKSSNFYLSIPNDVKEILLSKLNMYKLMSKVEIEDYSDKIYQYGLIREENEKSFKINDNLSIMTSTEIFTDIQDSAQWEIACINENLPEIHLITSEKHIPQALNLDIDQIGVAFSKGCYPGQEVVARMHYLGKPKRRLFRFTSKFEPFVGDSLDVNDSQSIRSSGQVIRVAKENNSFLFLGVFEVAHTNDKIFLTNNQEKLVSLINE